MVVGDGVVHGAVHGAKRGGRGGGRQSAPVGGWSPEERSSGRPRARTALVRVRVGVAGMAMAAVCVACGGRPVGDVPAARTPPPGSVLRAQVVKVLDGDTLDVRASDRTYRVRLLGIDAAEVAHEGRPVQCGADAARAALEGLLRGREVEVVGDAVADAQDRFGRRLGYVEVDGHDVGATMVELGRAKAWHPRGSAAPTRYAVYQRAAVTARSHGVGAWGHCVLQGR